RPQTQSGVWMTICANMSFSFNQVWARVVGGFVEWTVPRATLSHHRFATKGRVRGVKCGTCARMAGSGDADWGFGGASIFIQSKRLL
ncbi:MAG: hypothetical protein ACREWJ_13915, partial [Rhodoferax sp.]